MARKTELPTKRDVGSSPAYVDTSAFVAFLDRSDSHHLLFKRLFSNPPVLITSALVIAEGHGWFLRRYDRYRANQFMAFVELLSCLKVEAFERAALADIRPILARFDDQDLTLADAHGLVIIKGSNAKVCWSTDRHMGLTGVKLASSLVVH